jgi:threonylcarbamoyladenosine tRNA methylthiotransferase MtaB
MARGKSRNASIAKTVEMAQQAMAEGAKEIVLTGINTGDFGKSTNENFFDLVKALETLPDDIRFRISSIEPNLLTDEIISFIANSKHFMPHFHIPLQSGSNEVLKLMKRRYTTETFAKKIESIKKVMPEAFIGVDVIVGVKGETDELFAQSLEFIRELDISQLHVFSYSERAGTKMLEIVHTVSSQERKRRSEVLHALSDKMTKAFYNTQIGKTAQVLWESRQKDEKMVGFSTNYVRVERRYDKNLVNTVQSVLIGDWNEDFAALKSNS